MIVLSAKDLAVGYEGKAVLQNVSFEVKAGDYFCIVGENGSGKTTMLRTIVGLIPPISGELNFGDGFTKNAVGYLPQQSDVQRDFPASVFEIVLSGCQNGLNQKFFYSKSQKEMAFNNIERMGIGHLAKRCYRELSGGQQQRVLLARALCATKQVLILDEPVAGLDPEATEEMYRMIKRLNDEGLTIIMISHDIANVQKYANTIFDVNQIPETISVEGGVSTC